ncbi:MAG: response regulator transcription factor [Elusimicrobia bacterium]|nr:response regulator transcription factor [Elusimicrobiota bacterium]
MRVNAVYASRDPNRAGGILEAMGANNIAVTIAQRSKEVLGLLANRSCDLLLVGSRLADEDGVNLVKNLRARGPTRTLPIIALVEHADPASQADSRPKTPYAGFYTTAPAPGAGPAGAREKGSLRLSFFQAGADECLSLNWDVAECVARVKAVLRRIQVNPSEEVIKMGEVELNLTSYTVHVAGKQVSLTSKELDLLYVFLSSANRVLSRPYLIERVWGYNYFGSPRTVDVHVRRLREKLGRASRFITTIPCVGYKLVPPGGDMRR